MFNKSKKTLLSYGRKQIITALFLLLFFALTTTSYFILRPFVISTADTISSQLIKLVIYKNSNNLSDNHINKVQNFSFNLTNMNKYKILNNIQKSPKKTVILPVIYLIKNNLHSYFKQDIELIQLTAQPDYYWFQLPNKRIGNPITIGFSTDLIGSEPELTLIFLLLFLIILAITFSLTISKHLNSPLIALENVIEKLAKGDFSTRLPQHELAEINRTFSQVNKLSDDFKSMLEQRLVFLAGISHDIRTPVTRLKLLLAIHEQALSPNFIQPANRALNEIEALVKIYLDTGQLLVDEHIENIEPIDFIKEITNNFSPEHTNLIEINSSIKYIQTINIQALKRVLTNFISNAIKYAPPAKFGDINIKVKSTNQEKNASLIIIIGDNGLGINQTHLSEIYKPFYQAHTNNRVYSETESSGLGLSICRQICLSQGWSLSIINKEQPEHGLLVQLTIPKATLII